ncbi:DUF6264 family protein [Planococcus sp. APC 4015]|nr:DUF6264 family protein [Planococcus sp. APC 4015]
MSDPDPRPRPEYGEYATPEEQRSRIQQPDVTEALSAGVAPEPAPPAAAASVAHRPGSPVNRIVTIGLLAAGAVNVVFSVVSYLDILPTIERSMQIMGIPGDFTNVAAAQMWGIVAAVALVIGYALTAIRSLRLLRAGRVSWWVPIVGAVITYVIVSTCLAVPLVNDPAFTSYMTSLG